MRLRIGQPVACQSPKLVHTSGKWVSVVVRYSGFLTTTTTTMIVSEYVFVLCDGGYDVEEYGRKYLLPRTRSRVLELDDADTRRRCLEMLEYPFSPSLFAPSVTSFCRYIDHRNGSWRRLRKVACFFFCYLLPRLARTGRLVESSFFVVSQ